MVDKILCPVCRKMNDVHKFCVYCGHKLLDDEQIELILDNPEPYCLNCGRAVVKGQAKCECGYEFRIVDCPKCNEKNEYANRFCTECGEKLWTSNVCEIDYGEISFGIIDRFPRELRNTIMHSRYKTGSLNFPGDDNKIGSSIRELLSNKSRIAVNLGKIVSRWRIVSPNYCINCLGIVKPDEKVCKKCRFSISHGENGIGHNYVRPAFNNVQLKWNSKFSVNYLDSLAPAVGESQFEYRERLKWEFKENSRLESIMDYQIQYIKEEEKRRKREAERRKQEEEYIRQFGGGYCDSGCIHYREEFFDSRGGIVGDLDIEGYVEYHCMLGHSLGGFCKDYE